MPVACYGPEPGAGDRFRRHHCLRAGHRPPAVLANGSTRRFGSRCRRRALGSRLGSRFLPGEVIIASTHAAFGDVDAYLPEDEPLLEARASAEDLGGSEPVRPAGGAALRFLAAAIGARTVVEIGTGCGSSGIWLLRGMRPDAVLTSVDAEPEHQRLARKAFTEAGFPSNRYRLISGKALDVLPRLTDGAYDLVFCDADKKEYAGYLEQALRLLRPGGTVVFDNALWHDRVADPTERDEDTTAIRELGRAVREDERLVSAMLAAGDGLLVAVTRP